MFVEVHEFSHPRDRIDLHRKGTSAPCSQDNRAVKTRREYADDVQICPVPHARVSLN